MSLFKLYCYRKYRLCLQLPATTWYGRRASTERSTSSPVVFTCGLLYVSRWCSSTPASASFECCSAYGTACHGPTATYGNAATGEPSFACRSYLCWLFNYQGKASGLTSARGAVKLVCNSCRFSYFFRIHCTSGAHWFGGGGVMGGSACCRKHQWCTQNSVR